MEIIIKQSQHKVDPKHPESTDPTWKQAYLEGQRRIKQGRLEEQFGNNGEQKDWYMNRIKSNPQNVMGLPPFYPPIHIRSFIPLIEDNVSEEQKLLDKIESIQKVTCVLHCGSCKSPRESHPVSRLTLHRISPKDCFCTVCGKQKQYRTS